MPLAFFFHVQGLWLATLGAVILVSLYRLIELALRPSHRTGARAVWLDLGAGALIQIYVTFMAGFYLVLTGSNGGEWWTLASIITVVVTDVGAYATGLRFGRHKLAPNISPGKTWEGFAGSIVFAAVGFPGVAGKPQPGIARDGHGARMVARREVLLGAGQVQCRQQGFDLAKFCRSLMTDPINYALQ